MALFWVRAFRPLIANGLPQHPAGNGRLAFVKAGFRGLEARSPHDLRVGQQFTGDDAENLVRAVRDAANCIRNMPATYTKYPGSSEPMFPCTRSGPVRTKDTVRLDEAFLWSFGTFSVPVHLWRAMGRYAPWIEPAVLAEWIEIMRGYESNPCSWDQHMAALRWLDAEHDTGIVRRLGQRLRDSGSALFCVWTGDRLTGNFDIDHCFPFAAWPCNDLWNLLPSLPAEIRKKGTCCRHSMRWSRPDRACWNGGTWRICATPSWHGDSKTRVEARCRRQFQTTAPSPPNPSSRV